MRLALVNASLFGVDGDTVVISGSNVEVVGYESSLTSALVGARRVDLCGRTLLPGLHDSHTHIPNGGRDAVDLSGITSVESLRERIRTAASGKDGWLVGRGWDENSFKDRKPPTRWDIDEVTSGRPTILIRVCGHVALLNTAALKRFLEEYGEEGRRYLVMEGDKPTGLVVEDGVSLALRLAPPPTREEAQRVIQRYLRSYLRFGVTYLNVMSVGLKQLEWLEEALRRFPYVRVATYVTPEAASALTDWEGRVKVCGVKDFADGSFGGRTAFLREPYVSGGVGIDLLSEEAMRRYAQLAGRRGWQVAIHAIGDAAILKVLDLSVKVGLPGNMLRIEHASLTPPDIVERLREVSPHVVVQPHFLVSDWWLPEVLGEDRVRWVYAFNSMVKEGLKLYGSSDHPVEPLNPFLSVSAAVTRGMLQKHTHSEALSKD
ncbi:MAG: amidohydrolase, partial [Desulfurococcales archaeon]|nr:amidohydrolase [Desulfurococcales archaeon]